MALRPSRRPALPRFLLAFVGAATVGIVASLAISRRQAQDAGESAGQVSDAESLQGGPTTIYPDQAVAGYPESESGGPDEGPAGPNSRPDWQGPGTGA